MTPWSTELFQLDRTACGFSCHTDPEAVIAEDSCVRADYRAGFVNLLLSPVSHEREELSIYLTRSRRTISYSCRSSSMTPSINGPPPQCDPSHSDLEDSMRFAGSRSCKLGEFAIDEHRPIKIVCVGAGFSGIVAAIRQVAELHVLTY